MSHAYSKGESCETMEPHEDGGYIPRRFEQHDRLDTVLLEDIRKIGRRIITQKFVASAEHIPVLYDLS